MKKYLLVILALVTISCGSKKNSTDSDSWSSSPSYSTTKMKVTSNLSPDDLKREYINRLVSMGFEVNGGDRWGNTSNSMTTKFRYYENYYVRFYINFTDNVAIIRGEAGNIGLNGINQEPAAHNINWKPVAYQGRGWELMSIVAGIGSSQIEYNK